MGVCNGGNVGGVDVLVGEFKRVCWGSEYGCVCWGSKCGCVCSGGV